MKIKIILKKKDLNKIKKGFENLGKTFAPALNSVSTDILREAGFGILREAGVSINKCNCADENESKGVNLFQDNNVAA
ncbi:MAG: hypothetical protein RLZZ628_374 [Bacteroidota bacterium]|jgi:hypothetical protein